MFLNFFKDLSVKRVLNNSSDTFVDLQAEKKIEKVGVLIDETYFSNKEEILQLLIDNGILKENLSVLFFKNKYKKKEQILEPHFSFSNISWLGTIESQDVKDFIAQDFDLLISYYDENKRPLQVVTHFSKAAFKVGFASIENRFNHFMIDTEMENHSLFMNEMFKYLRILNRI